MNELEIKAALFSYFHAVRIPRTSTGGGSDNARLGARSAALAYRKIAVPVPYSGAGWPGSGPFPVDLRGPAV